MARDLLVQGLAPSAARQDAKAGAAVSIANDFEAVARAWHLQWRAARTEHHADHVIRRLEADVFPELGQRSIADLTAPMRVRMAKRIEARGALDIAKRALQTCGQICRYVVAHGFIERNLASDIKPGDVLTSGTKTNQARLDAKDLPELLRKAVVYNGTPHTRLALQLIALTFVRTSLAAAVQLRRRLRGRCAARQRQPARSRGGSRLHPHRLRGMSCPNSPATRSTLTLWP